MPAQFVWEGLPFDIVQQEMIQGPASCAFAALTRHMEYSLRITYAQADPPTELRRGPLFNGEFERQVRNIDPQPPQGWEVWDLLGQVVDEDMGNDDAAERLGIFMWHGLPMYAENRAWIDGKQINAEGLRPLFDSKIPPIAVIYVTATMYPHYAEFPYTGLGPQGNKLPSIPEGRASYVSHAVVLVGEYIPEDNDRFNLPAGEKHWLYQTSVQEGFGYPPSLFEHRIGILHPRVVTQVYYASMFPTNALLPADKAADAWALRGYVRWRKRGNRRAANVLAQQEQSG